ncbi:MAG: phosphotransferase [Planctomycetota bacterium]|nr:phosphotransferase [Planctomycetota bacterium]
MFDDLNIAQAVLRQQFRLVVQGERCDLQPVSGGFSGASVFKVECSEDSYCLRRWQPTYSATPRILAIHQVLELARTHSIGVVPVPLKCQSGSTLAEVDGNFWQLEPWMPGGADFQSVPTEARLKSSMTEIARFHRSVCEYAPSANAQRWFRPSGETPSPTVAERLRMISRYEGLLAEFEKALVRESDQRFRELGSRITCLFRAAKDRVRSELKLVVQLDVPNQPCIRDLWHDHLLFSADELTGIVDFGAMTTDSVACDLSRLCGSLFADDLSMWQRAIDQYENVRPLTDAEHRLLRPLDRSSVLLSGMTWLNRRYILHSTPQDLPPVCDRLEPIVARLETLVS